MSRAMLRLSDVNMSLLWRFTSQYLYGSANSPSLYLASNTRLQASSMVASLTLPSSTLFMRVAIKPCEHISMSVPALMACADASFRSRAVPWFNISPIEP